MAYVRWSNYSDLYAYADATGGFTIHIGGRRRRYGGPTLAWALRGSASHPDNKILNWLFGKYFFARYKLYSWSLEVYNWIFPAFKIGLDYDGETLNVSTFGELVELLAELNSMGYYLPKGFIEVIKKEIHEPCNGQGCNDCDLGERR